MASLTPRYGFTLPAGVEPVLRTVINSNMELVEQYMGNTQDMIAPLYSNEDTYSEGDIVTYNNKLYKALEDIDTAEDFDEDKWEETTAVAEGGGASNVEANPTGTPTDTLSTIGIDGTIYDIKGSGGGGTSEGEGVEIYSEDEYIVGKWVDGKKLYQKTVIVDNPIMNNVTTIDDVLFTDCQIIEMKGYGVRDASAYSAGDIIYPINTFEDNNYSCRVVFNAQGGKIAYQLKATNNLFSKLVITLRYTKTVETPAPAWGGSVNNYYANFIDTENVIQAETQVSSGTTGTYTATEDCYIKAKLWRSSTGASSLSIDGVEVLTNYSTSGASALYNIVPLKKGQTATVDAGAGMDCSYIVYGITYASGGSDSGSSKIEYSTEEREVGTWVDGSKLYQKTFSLTNITQGSSWNLNILGTTDISIENYEGYCDMILNGTSSYQRMKLNYNDASNNIRCLTNNDNQDLALMVTSSSHTFNIAIITIQYTKEAS